MSVDKAGPSWPIGFSAEVLTAVNGLTADIVACSGELDLSTSPQLDDALAGLDGSDIITDLTDVSFMDSTGVSVLVRHMRRLTDAGRRFVVICPDGVPRRVLSLTGLEETLNVCDSRAEAGTLVHDRG